MGAHTPFTKKVEAEFTSFKTLWRKRRWLALVILVGALGFFLWSIYSLVAQTQRAAGLEREVEKLTTALRESERENRGLRETVAPLLARAAREFPGEEINESLKKLLQRLEADRIENRPLVAATITVEVVTESDDKLASHFMDRGGYAALGSGSEALLLASSTDSFGTTIGPKENRFRSVFQMAADAKTVGRTLGSLSAVEYVQIEFAAMPEVATILRGKAVVVLNGSVRMEFEIPAQKSVGRRIFVRDVQDSIRDLLRK